MRGEDLSYWGPEGVEGQNCVNFAAYIPSYPAVPLPARLPPAIQTLFNQMQKRFGFGSEERQTTYPNVSFKLFTKRS